MPQHTRTDDRSGDSRQPPSSRSSCCGVASSRRRHAIVLSLLIVASCFRTASGYACSAVPSFALLQPRHLNRVSRYASMGYDGGCDCWSVSLNVDWRDLQGVQGVRSEGACKASWAITAVNAVELTMAMIASQLESYDCAFNISVQQVVDCEPSSSSCKGGWPASALDYMVDASNDLGGVVPEQQYPYKGKQAKCNAGKIATASIPLGLARYEQVDYYGWIGLMLAVQVQPVIAFVRGSYPSFQKYKSGVYDDPGCAAAGIVDHAVLVVGYEFTGSDGQGNWIVRNSWGTKWGEQGHMRMAFAGSIGICGIHSVPAIYPIIQVPSPCDSPQKPCGGGMCVPEVGGYSCQCPAGFVSYTNDDGTATCAPLDACGTQASNPCLTGTCINDNAGGYFCLCPPGYAKGSLTLGWETCTPSTDPPTTLTFPVDVDCPRVFQLYGLSEEAFLAQNPDLTSPCTTIPANTEINVAPTSTCINCSLFYSWTHDDTCSAVAGLFGIDETELTRLNPGLDCSGTESCQAPSPGQQVCVREGEGMAYPMCMWWEGVKPGDTCTTLMARYNLPALVFFWLNPGLACDNLFPNGMDITGVQVTPGGGDIGGRWLLGWGMDGLWSSGKMPSLSSGSTQASPVTMSFPTAWTSPACRYYWEEVILGAGAVSFFWLNPGLACDNLFPNGMDITGVQVTPGEGAFWASSHPAGKPPFKLPPWQQPAWQQRRARLVKAGVLRVGRTPVSKRRCLAFYSVTRGDFCARIISLKFQNSARKMSELNNGALAPNALAPCALAPNALAPCALAPCALAPNALAPCALAPNALAPCALAPCALAPCALAPCALTPCALAPCALAPFALAPCALAPYALAPSALAPNALAPCALAPCVNLVPKLLHYHFCSLSFLLQMMPSVHADVVYFILDALDSSFKPHV
ncbi:unnamed protein product [Closterium sp. Yama58-4]|nr:unnamed protein product [Closterium sp. Yama58-4]